MTVRMALRWINSNVTALGPVLLWMLLFVPIMAASARDTWLLSMLLLAAVIYGSLVSKWLRPITVLPTAISVLQLGYYLYSKQEIDKYFWMTLESTEESEAISFFGALTPAQLISLVLYTALCVCLIVVVFRRRNSTRPLIKGLGALVFVVALCVHVTHPLRASTTATLIHKRVARTYYGHIVASIVEARDFRIAETPMRATLSARGALADQILVVIGESASRLRMGVYGYSRDTTPLIGDGAFVFQNNVAVGLNTQPNVIALLTGKLRLPTAGVDQDIFMAAKTAGYRSVVIDNNSFVNNDPVVKISDQASRYISMNGVGVTSTRNDDRIRHDQVIMQPFFQQLHENRGRRTLYVVHLMGSHPLQDLRYPRAFSKFTSYYDNSILYTDYILSEIRNAFMANAKGPAVMVYLSDHGVRLPPGCGMGNEVPNPERISYGADDRYFSNYAVPLIVWTNASFRNAHPMVIDSLRANLSKPTDQLFLMDSVSQLMGLGTVNGALVLDKSIFSTDSNFEPRLNVFGKNIDTLLADGEICASPQVKRRWLAGAPVGTAGQ